MATDRILVHEDVLDEFLETMKASLSNAAASKRSLPNVATMASKARLQRMVAEAMSKGAHVVSGTENQDTVPGAAIFPTVLKDIDPSSTIWNEETFGPLLTVTSVRSSEEAVQIANSSEYGLSASIFTRDLRKGLGLAKQIQSGSVIGITSFPLSVTDGKQCGSYQ